MKCRNCSCWVFDDDANGAGMCENIQSPKYGCWTYPNDGCNPEEYEDNEDDD